MEATQVIGPMDEPQVATSQHACPINSLPGPLLLQIFSLLPASDLAQLACVQRSWRQLADDELLWKAHCARDWLEGGLATQDGVPCEGYKAVYCVYQHEFGRYGPLFLRAKRVVASLRSWTARHIPEVSASLGRGVSEAHLAKAEEKLGLQLPAALRVVYRLCDGQHLQADRVYEMVGYQPLHPSRFHGLFGGYSFYEHVVSVRLFPLHRLVTWSRTGVPPLTPPVARGQVVFAGSFEPFKNFFLDCNDGLVYVGTRDVRPGGQHLLAVPRDGTEQAQVPGNNNAFSGSACATPSGAGTGTGDAVPRDGLLRWMEEYASRLHSGYYSVRDLTDMEPSRGICIFPELPPACTTAVTQGVQVRCSAVLVPEACTSEDSDDRYYCAYCIRMRLLPRGDEDTAQHRGHRSVQLRSRHWMIRNGDELTDEVRGEAVIGKYPILRPGGEEFVYQSCTGLRASRGSIEGEFGFVPGTILSPEGDSFDVPVARFPLEVPAYIY